MKFSIITINYNNCKGLRKTVDSVISQTFEDYEWIVIDGGSTDGSKELIEHYSSHFTYWVSEPDNGIYEAMNKGLDMVNGDYCIFMNSGDAFKDVEVLSYVARLHKRPDVIAGSVQETTGKIISPPAMLSFRFLYSNNIPHQGEFIRKELFDKIGFYSTDLKILSDYEFNIKASLNFVSYCVIPITIAIVEEGGVSTTMAKEIGVERQIIFERLFPKSVLDDYMFWLDPSSYSHPVICWLVHKPKLMKLLNAARKVWG